MNRLAGGSDHDQSAQFFERPSPAVGVGYLVTAVAFFAIGGPLGVGLALGVVLAGMVAGPVVGFATSVVLLLVLDPQFSGLQLAIAGVGLGALLLGAAFDHVSPTRSAFLTGTLFVGLSGLTAFTLTMFESIVWNAGILLSVMGIAAYTIHRYELVQLDLVQVSSDE